MNRNEVADRLEFAAALVRSQQGQPRCMAQGTIALGGIAKWGVTLRRGWNKAASPGGFGTPVITCLDIADRRGPRLSTLDDPKVPLGLKKESAKVVEEGDILVALSAPHATTPAVDWMVGAVLGREVAVIRVDDNAMVPRDWVLTFLRSDSFREQMQVAGADSAPFAALKVVMIPVPEWGMDHDIRGFLKDTNEVAAAVADAVTAWTEWDNELGAHLQSVPEPPLFDA